MSSYRLLLDAHDEIGEWVSARTPNPQSWIRGSGHAIGWTIGERLVAGVTYSLYNGANVWMSIASEDSRWISRSSLWAIFHYPFKQLQVKRISALVDASNHRSQRFVEKLGLVREATFVDSAPDGDQHVYRLLAADCKWINDLRWHREDKREAA